MPATDKRSGDHRVETRSRSRSLSRHAETEISSPRRVNADQSSTARIFQADSSGDRRRQSRSSTERSSGRRSTERHTERDERNNDRQDYLRDGEIPAVPAAVSAPAPPPIKFLSKHSNEMLHRRRNDEATNVAGGKDGNQRGGTRLTAAGGAWTQNVPVDDAQQAKSDKVPSRFDPEYVEMRKLFTEVPWTCEETELLHDAFFLLSDGFTADLIMLHALYPHRTRRDVEARVAELLQSQPVTLRLLAEVKLDSAERRQRFRTLAEKGRQINGDVQKIRELMWKASRKNINHGLHKWEGIVRLGMVNIPEIRRTQFTMAVLKENMEAVLVGDKSKYSKPDKSTAETPDAVEAVVAGEADVDNEEADSSTVSSKQSPTSTASRHRKRKSSESSARTADSARTMTTAHSAADADMDGDENYSRPAATKSGAKRAQVDISPRDDPLPRRTQQTRAMSRENAAAGALAAESRRDARGKSLGAASSASRATGFDDESSRSAEKQGRGVKRDRISFLSGDYPPRQRQQSQETSREQPAERRYPVSSSHRRDSAVRGTSESSARQRELAKIVRECNAVASSRDRRKKDAENENARATRSRSQSQSHQHSSRR